MSEIDSELPKLYPLSQFLHQSVPTKSTKVHQHKTPRPAGCFVLCSRFTDIDRCHVDLLRLLIELVHDKCCDDFFIFTALIIDDDHDVLLFLAHDNDANFQSDFRWLNFTLRFFDDAFDL